MEAAPEGVARRPRRPRPRLSDEAATYVRELILSGQVRPGEYLRPETLADLLDMSPTPVREGLLSLQSEGFLNVRPRRGFVVAPLSLRDISDAFAAQALLAGELAARATARASVTELDALATLGRQLEDAARSDRLDVVQQLNHEFHRTINVFAQAPKLTWLLRATMNYVPRQYYARIGGWTTATVTEHRVVLEAMNTAEPEQARSAMSAHVQNAGRLLVHHLATAVGDQA